MDLKKVHKDYDDFLKEYGFTQEFVNVFLQMNTVDDKDSKSLVVIKDSDIEGKGMFAIRHIKKGEYIAMGRVSNS